MNLSKMDKTLIEIYNIKNLEEISIYDLVSSSSSYNKSLIIPCVFISYDGGKVLNLCSKDKYFDVYIKKVYETYLEEKDNIVKYSPFRSSMIKIDDKSRKILETKKLESINNIYSFYDKKEGYNDRLLFEKDEFKLYLYPLLYHIKDIYSNYGIVINYDDFDIQGYRENYIVNIKLDGLDEQLLINYKKNNEKNYDFIVRCKNDKFKTINLKLGFGKEEINVFYDIYNYNISGEYSYKILNDKILFDKKAYENNRLIINKKESLDRCENNYSSLTSLDNDEDMMWFSLPWGGMYGINNSEEKIDDNSEFINSHNMYFYKFNDSFITKEYYAKSYKKNGNYRDFDYKVIMEEIRKNIIGLRLFDNIYILESYFDNNMINEGYYDNYLEYKYFYHILDTSKEINKDNLVYINQNDNIIYGSDLCNEDSIRKLIRGK